MLVVRYYNLSRVCVSTIKFFNPKLFWLDVFTRIPKPSTTLTKSPNKRNRFKLKLKVKLKLYKRLRRAFQVYIPLEIHTFVMEVYLVKRFRPFELLRTAKLVLLPTEQGMGKFDLTTLIVKAGAMVFTIMNVFPTISSHGHFLC